MNQLDYSISKVRYYSWFTLFRHKVKLFHISSVNILANVMDINIDINGINGV